MIRVMKMSGRFYGIEVNLDKESEIENIKIMVGESTPVLLVEDLGDVRYFGIEPVEVEMVEPQQ